MPMRLMLHEPVASESGYWRSRTVFSPSFGSRLQVQQATYLPSTQFTRLNQSSIYLGIRTQRDITMAAQRPFTSIHKLLSTLLTLALPRVVHGGIAQTDYETIASLDAYSSLGPCAQSCFFQRNPGAICSWVVEDALGCNYDGCGTAGLNTCICRTDKQYVGVKHLSTCIASLCTIGDPDIDISLGIGIYTDYCTSLGYPYVPPEPVTQTVKQTRPEDNESATAVPRVVPTTITETVQQSTPTEYVYITMTQVVTRSAGDARSIGRLTQISVSNFSGFLVYHLAGRF